MSGNAVVGRDAELEAIAAALDAVAGGERRLLVLRGEAGIGKTRLLDVVRAGALERRFTLLDGRAAELEADVPLASVIDALEPAVRDLPAPALRDLGADQLRRLADVLPEIADEPAGRFAPTAPADRWRLHRALRELLDVLGASRPIALVLDDVHWADPATLELLDHVVRRPPSRPHLIALATRPGATAERLLAARRAVGEGLQLDLPPLARGAADELLAGIDVPSERERLYRESGGNPLLLEELARVGTGVRGRSGGAAPAGGAGLVSGVGLESGVGPGVEVVPGGVVAAVGAELRGLPEGARALLDGAAIAGDPFDLDLAAAVAGLARSEALGALDVLVERALVRPTADARRFAFRHPVIRSAVYAGVPAGARLGGHEAAARALAGAPLPAQARHLAQAAVSGDVEAATTLRAAAALVRPQAPAIAADWLLAARRADPHVGSDGLSTLAETLVESGRLADALEIVEQAAAGAEGASLVRLAIAGAGVERLLGRHLAARQRLESALEIAEPGALAGDAPPAASSAGSVGDASGVPPRSGRGAARLMADLALSAYQRGDYPELARWAHEAFTAPDADAVTRAAAGMLLGLIQTFAGDRDDADDTLREALAAFDSANDEEIVGAAELMTAVPWGAIAVERLEDGLAAARRVAAVVRAGGNGPAAVALDLAVVLSLGLLGRIEEAVEHADLTEQAARVTGNDQAVQWVLWMRAWARLEHGELDRALAGAEESVALAERIDDSALVTIARAVLGAVLVAHGRFAEGRPLLAAYEIEPGWICRWAVPLVEAEIALGELDAAAEHAAHASTHAAAIGLPGPSAAAGRAEALVALAGGDAARAADLARQAVTDADRIGGRLDAARAHLIAGRALAALAHDAGRAAAATELAEAERLATASGGPRVRDEAVRELRRLGRRVGRGGKRAPGGEGIGALSPREREIAELVAAGNTNREIAERLFLSEKTIETHLSRVFGKLGVRSRAQVAAAVAASDDG